MTNKYYPTIGLEIHAELKTNTKMFCSCKNDPDEQRPNVNICPVCMAHPGALPVANNKHFENKTSTSSNAGFSLIDFNRAGIPLMELVTEPHTFESPEEMAKKASKFAKELQLILWYLNVSEANMEKGEMRVEANISLSPDPKVLGTKVEVKNLNSFRSVERAIIHEIERMKELHENGKAGEIAQETRGWDENKQQTF